MQSCSDATVHISSEFDSGNIVVVDDSQPDTAGVQLRIRPDVYTELEKKAHLQWFHFKATNVSDGTGDRAPTKFVIKNAGQTSFPDAWPGTTGEAHVFSCLHPQLANLLIIPHPTPSLPQP